MTTFVPESVTHAESDEKVDPSVGVITATSVSNLQLLSWSCLYRAMLVAVELEEMM